MEIYEKRIKQLETEVAYLIKHIQDFKSVIENHYHYTNVWHTYKPEIEDDIIEDFPQG